MRTTDGGWRSSGGGEQKRQNEADGQQTGQNLEGHVVDIDPVGAGGRAAGAVGSSVMMTGPAIAPLHAVSSAP